MQRYRKISWRRLFADAFAEGHYIYAYASYSLRARYGNHFKPTIFAQAAIAWPNNLLAASNQGIIIASMKTAARGWS
jgi:hypothetical protein